MKDVTFGQYYPADSFVHRMDARIKILLSIAFIVAVFLVKSYRFTGFAACAVAIAIGVTMTVFACRRLHSLRASRDAEGAAEGTDGERRSAEALPAPEGQLLAETESGREIPAEGQSDER